MFVDEVITTNTLLKGNDMNIKTEFEQFLASKAEEFVSNKANMTIAEFRELNSVLDTCGIDFSNLPPHIALTPTKRIVSGKSKITTEQIRQFVLSSLTGGNMVTRKELYASIDIHFADSLTAIDYYAKRPSYMTNIKSRVYQATTNLKREGKVDDFISKDGKTYFKRIRSNKPVTESQMTVTN
jgi:hypothetical protein